SSRARPPSSRRSSNGPSGATSWALTPWPWTGPSGNAGCERRTRATACTPGSRAPVGAPGWRVAYSTAARSPGGACGPWPPARPAGAVFVPLLASLGIEVDGMANRVNFRYPELPRALQKVWVEDLRVGDGSVGLVLARRRDGVGLNVLKRSGRVEVTVVK